MELMYKHLRVGETFMFLPTANRKGGGPFQKLSDSTYFDQTEGRMRRIASISVLVSRTL